MIDIENDELLGRLADFVGVDLLNLEIIDEDERWKIEHAHEISKDAYDDLKCFFSRVKETEFTEFMGKAWVFKALKFNDEFYIQNIILIRATEWMREEIYTKKIKKITSQIQFDNTVITTFSVEKEEIPEEYRLSAASSGGGYKLPQCYKNDTNNDYEITFSEVLEPENSSFEEILIKLKPNDMSKFLIDNRTFYIKIFKTDGKAYSIGPVVPIKNGDSVDICKHVPKGTVLGNAWGISYNEEIKWKS